MCQLRVFAMRLGFYDSQQAPPISHCAHCRNEIYREDECYIINGVILCADCLEDFEKETRHSMTGYELNDYLNHLYGGLADIE